MITMATMCALGDGKTGVLPWGSGKLCWDHGDLALDMMAQALDCLADDVATAFLAAAGGDPGVAEKLARDNAPLKGETS
jgi:hypothetical protein